MSINSAAEYSRNLDPVLEVIGSIISHHSNLIDCNREMVSVMDIGIGDGRMAKQVIMPIFENNLQEFVGCDVSASALDHAEREINLSKFSTVQMDIGTLNVPEDIKNRFTNIFSCLCLHNVKNIR